MSNYTKATNFATKDTLPTGDANKIVKGTEIDNEFNSISGAISSKADIASPTFTGTPAAPTATAGSNTTQLATTAFVTAALQAVYPVGSIYINATSSSNPSSLLGFGTWEAFGAGRVMVGLNASDALFDTAEETGGSKDAVLVSHNHTFSGSGTTSAVGDHQHWAGSIGTGSTYGAWYSSGNSQTHQTQPAGAHDHTFSYSGTTSTGGSSATNANIQPYIVVRMWKRVS
jgi:hypothetical protein